MNYNAALKDFQKAKTDLAELVGLGEIGYNNNTIDLQIRAVSMLIVRHYKGDLAKQGEIWGNHLVKIPKVNFNNHLRLNDIRALVDEIIKDVESRTDEEELNNPTSGLQGQLKAVQSDLTKAENKKNKLLQEINHLEANRTTISILGEQQEFVAKIQRQKIADETAKINSLKNDLSLVQSEINGLKADKTRIEDKIDKELSKPQPILPTANEKEIAELKSTNRTVINENESLTKENTELRREVQVAKNSPTYSNDKFYKPFLTVMYILLSYVWLSASTKILGFDVKDNFKYGVAVSLLILYGVLFFTKKEKIQDHIVQFILAIGSVVLAAFFFYR